MNKSHLTAISRKKLSAPMRHLCNAALLVGRCLDYGCGRGFDADELEMVGYDPHHRTRKPRGKFDTITCNYVLNVIESASERASVVAVLRSLLRKGGKAYISVRNDKANLNGLTSRGTWQGLIDLDLPLVKSTAGFKMYLLEKV